ncbi:phosphoesterase [Nocardioides baekrokdamisoli]|uniref:phospholipase C n=1 Tax=Nocardioides baekrokdamisoli TaxID=1804624 RepID=A0A3G9IQB3_9ACTN|nr:alkaline phosphatase family protein [Nocardioides baekrokdamisoli]BBH18245.1 phosphoesterase [Nocardioides baekrokdamisoli]
MTISRRTLLGAAGAVAGGAGLAMAGAAEGFGSVGPVSTYPALPAPADSGIEHIVVVMMENRSFDHFLGWVPNADGKQAGLTYVDRYGVPQKTYHLAAFNNCGFNDPDHSYEGGRIEFNDGKCDGFLKAGLNDVSAIGYYDKADLPFLGRAAQDWTTFDRYFSAVMAETYPNRFYMHSAQTDRLHNGMAQSTLPTIWDSLAAAGVKGTYFFNDVPFTALWYTKHLAISQPYALFKTQAALGQLPAVSYIDPRFEDEASGTSNDDHPHADIRAGEAFLNEVYDAVRTSPNWDKTVLVITFDEWGGFYDHVAPEKAPDVSAKTALRGFRVPTIVISPLARRGHVGHNTYDHTSVLKMIEWRFGLPPLTVRDANARNLAEALDFSSVASPNLTAPAYTVPNFTPLGCTAGTGVSTAELGSEFSEWGDLKALAQKLGVVLPV